MFIDEGGFVYERAPLSDADALTLALVVGSMRGHRVESASAVRMDLGHRRALAQTSKEVCAVQEANRRLRSKKVNEATPLVLGDASHYYGSYNNGAFNRPKTKTVAPDSPLSRPQ